LFDLFESEQRAAVDAGAFFCRFLPVVRTVEIPIPERPGPALIGPDRINRADAFVIGADLQEDAIIGASVFDDAGAKTDACNKTFAHFRFRHAQMPGKQLDFHGGNPDIALFRPGTAVAAAGALKMQPAQIPSILHFLPSIRKFQIKIQHVKGESTTGIL